MFGLFIGLCSRNLCLHVLFCPNQRLLSEQQFLLFKKKRSFVSSIKWHRSKTHTGRGVLWTLLYVNLWSPEEQTHPDVPFLGLPVLSVRPKPLSPGRWWRRRWTWRPRGSAPQSSSSRRPPVYKRRKPTANKHTVTGLFKQKKKKKRGLLCRQDKHVIQKYFEIQEWWNAN